MHDQPLEPPNRTSPTQLNFAHPWLSEALVVGQPPKPPVEHPGWTKARADLLTEIAGEPALLALVGPPGTGKTMLLHTILADIQQSGHTAAIMSGGVLPFEFTPGRVALLDNATEMEAEALAPLCMLCDVTMVLAGGPELADHLTCLPGRVVVVPLGPLPADDVRQFITTWLETHDLPKDVADDAAIARLSACSQGVPRTLVRLLRASVVLAGHYGWARIRASCIDEVVALQEPVSDAPAAVRPILVSRPLAEATAPVPMAQLPVPVTTNQVSPFLPAPQIRPHGMVANVIAGFTANRRTRLAASAFAVAALVAVVLFFGTQPDFRTLRPNPSIAAVHASGAEPAGSTPSTPDSVATAPGPVSTAQAQAAPSSDPGLPATPERPAAATQPPPDHATAPAQPQTVDLAAAAITSPHGWTETPRVTALAGAGADTRAPPGHRVGAPGLALIAQAGDTLPTLYARIYRDVRPPPYAEFAAANQAWSGRGGIVLFPAPAGGWTQN
jgi:hypothetical protein